MKDQTSNIKLRIILITFAMPVSFAIVMLVAHISQNLFFNVFIAFALLVGTLVRISVIKRKYITRFTITHNKLTVHYLDPFLQPKVDEFEINQLQDMELTLTNWLTAYPAAVNIKFHENWTTFHIVSKQLFDIIKGRIASARAVSIKQ
jgi:hypothetical protein